MQVDSILDVKCECVFVCAHALMLECMCARMCLWKRKGEEEWEWGRINEKEGNKEKVLSIC